MVLKKQKALIFIFLFLLFCSHASLIFALEIIYPPVPFAQAPQDFINTAPAEQILSLYVKYFIHLAITIAGIAAFVVLIWGGIGYLISAGNAQAIAEARNRISSALWGILIILCSFLVLKSLNPELTILKIPAITAPQLEIPPDVPVPRNQVNTSIEIEMPIGRIIESVLEMYVSKVPEPANEKPRMQRLKENAEKIKEISNTLRSNSERLKSLSDQCRCENTRPDPPCNHYGCSDCPPKECSCDPCKNVRSDIQSTEQNNLTKINELKLEQIKTESETLLLKEEIDRLERGQKFINECPARSTLSLAQLYLKDDYFKTQNWQTEVSKFWDNTSIVYNRPVAAFPRWNLSETQQEKKPINDYSTFYCSQSGTLEQDNPFPSPDLTGNESEQGLEEILSESMACSSEAPVGEITDRAKRVARLLIVKFNEITDWEKKLTEAVDKLQVLVSQCSSKRCYPVCQCISCGHDCSYCLEIGCFGEPCPSAEISSQLDEIKRIHQEIINRIDGKNNRDIPSDIGVMQLIQGVSPGIILDWDTIVRHTMTYCQAESWQNQDTALLKCGWSQGATDPSGKVIYNCCWPEYWENGERKDTALGQCYEECYLKMTLADNRKCVQYCLDRKGQQLNDKELPLCKNILNFYCCHTE